MKKKSKFNRGLATSIGLASVMAFVAMTNSGSVFAASAKQSVTIWENEASPQQVIQTATNLFNKSQSAVQANVQFYSNDAYKQKIQIAMGANNPPDLIFGWGGGVLKTYLDANKVLNLDGFLKANPKYKNKFFPGVWGNVTFNGHIYGVPEGAGTQPELLFYNKSLFKKYNVPIPTTWNLLLKDVSLLKSKGVIPIALGARDQWPDLMWLMYLTDRIGGPTVFQDIINKHKDAWSNPSILRSLNMLQQLVKVGAFENGYGGVSADSNEDQALLYSGKSAMLLQGSWVFPSINTSDPAFTKTSLAWMEFPTVSNEKGNPADLMGNISNYYYIYSKSKSIQGAEDYLKNVPFNNYEITQDIESGVIPPIKGIEDMFAHAPNSKFLTETYKMAEKAPVFVTGWDQLLPPSEAQTLLSDLSSVFLLQMKPQTFIKDMNAALATS